MKIQSVQKIIKVGTSKAVTLPARDLKAAGLGTGDEVNITVWPVTPERAEQVELVALTQKLIKRHKQALKNLSQR